MSDISKEELEKEIAKILSKANLATTSTKKVRQQLEASLGRDLADQKLVIDQLVMDYVNSKEEDEEEEEEEGGEGSSSDEEPPPAKTKPKPSKKRKQSSDDDDSEEEEEKPKPKKKAGRKKKKGSDDSDDDWAKKEKANKPKKAGGRGKGGGYTRAYKLSPALAELMGADEMARHEVVKKVWALIKEKQLYDPSNRQFAICDDALYKVFQTKRFRTFGMMKYLKTHFLMD
ncbi:unnamed protein product [Plutella xylostella]|uniref:(diamondback moth) hypothetical protein n=1 Tax=Plutella xylostella TaxID=51655 RepID=A0A8S4G113_PLUXY|nr:unnamed protein product [Plutella xylostella]